MQPDASGGGGSAAEPRQQAAKLCGLWASAVLFGCLPRSRAAASFAVSAPILVLSRFASILAEPARLMEGLLQQGRQAKGAENSADLGARAVAVTLGLEAEEGRAASSSSPHPCRISPGQGQERTSQLLNFMQ